MRKLRHYLLALGITVCSWGSVSGSMAIASVPESMQIWLYPGSASTYINGLKVQSETPMIEHEGRYFLPAAEFTRWFGMPVIWEDKKGAVQLTAPKAFLEFVFEDREIVVNGIDQPWGNAVLLHQDRLYIELEWLAQYISYQSRVDQELDRLELRYIKLESNLLFRNDTMPHVLPIAKFTVDKEAYRIGEPISYSNLSYDPKGNELTDIDWTGNAEAIFTPGLYKVSLQVTDSQGNVSNKFSRNILVKDEPYLDPFEYSIYNEPVGTYVREEESVLRQYLRGIPQLHHTTLHSKERPLIVSDSPEAFTEKGILYKERVNGKARLYATHLNDTDKKMKFAIAVTNPNSAQSVTIKTTNEGEVYPSIYANLMGNEPTIDFLLDHKTPETMVLGPSETAYYKVMPDFYPDQGMNVMYDVETDKDVYFSFLAMDEEDTLDMIESYAKLPYSGNVRGTFDSSEVTWHVDASALSVPSSFAIGDGVQDKFVTGYDFFTREASENYGNYGVVYHIHVNKPPKMAVLILARGGVFKGPFLVNGRIVQTPPSGVMGDYQGYTIIAKTDGTEQSLDLDFSPASGSAFPIDVILYPLADK